METPQTPEVHVVLLLDGRELRVPTPDYLRIEALAAIEGLSVGEWFERHLPDVEGSASTTPQRP